MRKRVIAAFIALFCAIAALDLPAAATGTAEKIRDDKNSILTLQYKDEGKALQGAKFYLYQVGTYRWNDTNDAYDLEVTDEFKEAKVTLPSLSFWNESNNAKKTGEKANTLVEYVQDKEVNALDNNTTSSEGNAIFANLKQGLYLVRGDPAEIDGTWYVPQSFLIPLPYPTEDGFNYKVTAKVKHETGAINIVVYTSWKENGNILENPGPDTDAFVSCEDSTVKLDADNEWSYTWNKEYREDWENYWGVDKITGFATGWTVSGPELTDCIFDGGTVKIIFKITFTRDTEPTPPPSNVTITVNKVWVYENGKKVESPVDSVTVQLLNDGRVADIEKLDSSNNWKYQWSVKENSSGWSVREIGVPDGWEVSYKQNGNDWTITNMRSDPGPVETGPIETDPTEPSAPPDGPSTPPDDPDDPSGPSAPPNDPDDPSGPSAPPDDPNDPSEPSAPPNDPDGPGLPQTGQVWWPVPLLAAAGVLLLLIGAVLFARKEEPHE